MTAIRAVVFDIGGVLEIPPDLRVDRRWEARLGFPTRRAALTGTGVRLSGRSHQAGLTVEHNPDQPH